MARRVMGKCLSLRNVCFLTVMTNGFKPLKWKQRPKCFLGNHSSTVKHQAQTCAGDQPPCVTPSPVSNNRVYEGSQEHTVDHVHHEFCPFRHRTRDNRRSSRSKDVLEEPSGVIPLRRCCAVLWGLAIFRDTDHFAFACLWMINYGPKHEFIRRKSHYRLNY